MPILHSAVKIATRHLPKVISPTAHAVLDYLSAAVFLGTGAFLLARGRNKHAAISALVCGVAETTTALLTDFPGGAIDLISFPTHGKIDMGLATMTASFPEFMEFEDELERKFFRIQALMITANAGLTPFRTPGAGGSKQ
jgi:hypothetical protein